MQPTLARLNIVGTGPGSPEYITPATRKVVRQAQIVIGAQRSLNLFAEEIVGEKMVLTAKNLNSTLKFAVESAERSKEVVILSTGDPGFSGLLRTILKKDFANNVKINVVPGISSIQACAAKLAMCWDNACLFTFHEGEVTEQQKNELAACAKKGRDLMILPDPKAFSHSEIANFLLESGLDKATPVLICENLTLTDEKITSSSLEKVCDRTFGSLSVMVIKQTPK